MWLYFPSVFITYEDLTRTSCFRKFPSDSPRVHDAWLILFASLLVFSIIIIYEYNVSKLVHFFYLYIYMFRYFGEYSLTKEGLAALVLHLKDFVADWLYYIT